MSRFFLFILILSLSSCNLDRWDLKDESNELIPNYSLTVDGLACNETFHTNLFELDDNSFVTAILDENNLIKIIRVKQSLINETWSLNYDALWSSQGSELIGFEKSKNNYFIFYKLNGWPKIEKFDKDFKITGSYDGFESFIDTFYNDISELSFVSMISDTSKGLYLTGQLSSFSKTYSCVFKMDTDLKPVFIKTYFENDTVKTLFPLDADRFIVLNQHINDMSVILDNKDGKSYKKYDLGFNETFKNAKLSQMNGKLYLTGNLSSGTGKTIEITLESKNAFISDVRNFEINDLTSIVSSRNTLLMAGANQREDIHYSFLTEYKDRNYLWCNEFQGFEFVRILSILEAPDVGLVYLYLIRKEDKHYLHFIRTDEEGATLENPYNQNCLL
ncbi:MAG: hypothetical protein IPN79_15150 [Saprospiraceae bacterium]|nr:hypothetical protein [Saprospiraceae bacterium]